MVAHKDAPYVRIFYIYHSLAVTLNAYTCLSCLLYFYKGKGHKALSLSKPPHSSMCLQTSNLEVFRVGDACFLHDVWVVLCWCCFRCNPQG